MIKQLCSKSQALSLIPSMAKIIVIIIIIINNKTDIKKKKDCLEG
jgi:hypothetical protein